MVDTGDALPELLCEAGEPERQHRGATKTLQTHDQTV
jgi:hypothetical protein